MKGIAPTTPPDVVEKTVRREVSNFFYREAKNRPTMLVVAMPIA